jgi:tetratricopeptide (TPR) repeat protein
VRPPALTVYMHPVSLPETQQTALTHAPIMQPSPMSGFGTTPREPPRQVGRYRLVSQLGQGGMGVVFEAEDPDLGRTVALKFMNASQFLEEHVSRFLRESRLAARLRHPNIVTVHEVGTAELFGHPVPYLCMELIRGRTLQDDFTAGGYDVTGVVSVIERIARAVHYAHEEGVLHRDLKPSNILIDAAGTPFLTDFGLARPLDNATQLTLSGVMIGTPDYMSPEQATGRTRDLGPWTDVWSLGVLLYQAVTTALPFRKDNVLGTLSAIREDDPTPMLQLNPAASHDLELIVQKALQKSHARRYATARDLANDLKRWLGGEKIETDSGSQAVAQRQRTRNVRDLWESLGHSLLLKGDYIGAEEAFEAVRDAAERQGASSPATEARQLRNLAIVSARLGRIEVAIRRCDEGIAKAGKEDPAGAAWLDAVAGLACCYDGRFADAALRARCGRQRLEESAAGSETDRAGAEAMLCRTEGNVLLGQGQALKAAHSFEAGLVLSRKSGDRVEESTALFNVADAYAHAGDTRRAFAGFEEALLAKAGLGDRWGLAGTHNKLAWLHLEWGDPGRALEMAIRGTSLAEQTEDRRMISVNRLALGQIRLSRNELEEARRECVAALDHAAAIGATPEVIECLLGLAAVDRQEGLAVRAGERVARAKALAEQSGESAFSEIQARFARLKTPALELEAMGAVCQDLAEAGKVEQATEILRSLAERAGAVGLVSAEADALLLMARLTKDLARARAAQALADRIGELLRRARAARLVADLCDGAPERAAAEALKAQLLQRVPADLVEAARAAWAKGPLPI